MSPARRLVLRLTKPDAKLAILPLTRLVHLGLQANPIPPRKLLPDTPQMPTIPVQPHEPADEQLVPQLDGRVVRGDVGEGVMEQERVAQRAVDDAVEDVREEFALTSISRLRRGNRRRAKREG